MHGRLPVCCPETGFGEIGDKRRDTQQLRLTSAPRSRWTETGSSSIKIVDPGSLVFQLQFLPFPIALSMTCPSLDAQRPVIKGLTSAHMVANGTAQFTPP